MGRAIGGGVAGGLVAGTLVGLGEALVVWWHAHATGGLPPAGWGMLAYGLLGGAAGGGAGLLAGMVRMDGFALALASVLAALGFLVARFRIIRDVFQEQLPPGRLTQVIQAGALLTTVAVAVVVFLRLRGLSARHAPFTRPVPTGAVVGLLAGAWLVVAGGMATPPVAKEVAGGAARAGAPNVLLIVVDALRADHLSSYGYAANRTPHIDGLAADGTRFERMFAQAPWTRPSIATVLTGLYPSSHGAIRKADPLPDRVDTIAEVLAKDGYRTVAFAHIAPGFNFGQGFAEYHYLSPAPLFGADEAAEQLMLYDGLRVARARYLSRSVDVRNYYHPAEDVTAAVRGWVESSRAGADQPFFMLVHYMDPHEPYVVHPFNGEGYARVAVPNPPGELADAYRKLYDGEISYLDEHLGLLFRYLKERGLYDRTLILLTADHGEEFQEHGGWWHGTTLYDEQLRVPLIVKPPLGGSRGRVVDTFAASLDIAPTIYAAAKVKAPAVIQGHALALDAAAPDRERVFAENDLEGNVLQAVRTRDWKLITANPGNPRGLAPEELYDVAKDSGERRNLAGDETTRLEDMRATLGKSYLEARAHAGAGAETDVDAATLERLRALGYVN